jgi:hypothetical protein
MFKIADELILEDQFPDKIVATVHENHLPMLSQEIPIKRLSAGDNAFAKRLSRLRSGIARWSSIPGCR